MQVTKLVATTSVVLEFAPVSDTLGVFRLTSETVDSENKLKTTIIENFAQLDDLKRYFEVPRHFGETLVSDSSQWIAASPSFRKNLIKTGLGTEAIDDDKESDTKPFTFLTSGKRTVEDLLNFDWTTEIITNLRGEIIPYVINYDLTILENVDAAEVKHVLRQHPGVTLIESVEASPDEVKFEYRPTLEEMYSFKDYRPTSEDVTSDTAYLENSPLNEAWGSVALRLDVFGLNKLLVKAPVA